MEILENYKIIECGKWNMTASFQTYEGYNMLIDCNYVFKFNKEILN